MKISQKSNRKKIILIAIVLIATLGVVAVFIYQIQRNNNRPADETRPMNDVAYTEATPDEKEAVDQHKEQLADEQDQAKQGEQSDQPPADQSLTLTITRASQGGAGQPLNIRTLVSGASSGDCEMTLAKNGQPTISKKFLVVFEATSASCSGADIPASDFSMSGEWALKAQVKKDARQSAIVEQTVTITK